MEKCRLDLIQSDAGWSWAFFAKNAEQVSRSSQPVVNRADMIRSAELGSPVIMLREHLKHPEQVSAMRWDVEHSLWEPVVVREVDARER